MCRVSSSSEQAEATLALAVRSVFAGQISYPAELMPTRLRIGLVKPREADSRHGRGWVSADPRDRGEAPRFPRALSKAISPRPSQQSASGRARKRLPSSSTPTRASEQASWRSRARAGRAESGKEQAEYADRGFRNSRRVITFSRLGRRVPDHVVYRKYVRETVILNLDTGTYHGLNRSGGKMLETLGAAATVRGRGCDPGCALWAAVGRHRGGSLCVLPRPSRSRPDRVGA